MEKIKIEKLDHQGRGIGYLEDKIVFVDNSLPGEMVEIEITKDNSKIKEAKVINYIDISDERIESNCPYYEECGGCNLLHINYLNQLNYKQNKVKEILTREDIVEINRISKIVPSPRQFGYRNKVTLKNDGKLGYYKNKSYEIVDINKCLLANDKINDAIINIRNYEIPNNVEEVVIRSINEKEISLTIYLRENEKIDNFLNEVSNLFDSIKVIEKKKTLYEKGKSNIIGRLRNFEYQMGQNAFFQVNTDQTINLYDKISDYIKGKNYDTALDLYCGTGTIGIYISKFVNKVIGVEINSEAIENAKINALNNKVKNIDFIVGDTKKILLNKFYKADVIIVDPPRSGLDKEVIDRIILFNPSDIIYVSCDPITLARDLKLLKNKYIIEEVTPFDMFPNTYHVECVAKLSRK